MKLVDFKIPTRLDEARNILKQLGSTALPIAGSTSLVFAAGKDDKVAVDITRLGLHGIRKESGTFRIGATTTIAAMQKHREDGWVLDRVAKHLASQQIRNISTLGGNIVRVFPWADFPVALLALNAEMVIAGEGGERVAGADEFFAGQPTRLLKPGELLAAVKVKSVPLGSGFGYRKEARAHMGFSVMTAAALLEADGRKIKSARVAVGAGVPFPARLKAVEDALVGKPASESLFKEAAAKGAEGLKVKSAAGNTDEYTLHLAPVVMCDALAEAWKIAAGK
jgi:aerobic carbon-monoxide dehydrogenase medium subunit